VASISGGCSRRSGNRFGRIALGKFQGRVCREGVSLGWGGSGELIYGTDAIIGSLRGGIKPRMSPGRGTGEDVGRSTVGADL